MDKPLRVVSFGECMLELHGTAFGTLQQGHGGDAYNTAVYLARCGGIGLRVGWASAVGDDALSDGLLSRWAAEGLELGCIRRVAGRLAGLYQISTDAAGERRFSYWRSDSAARAYFDTEDGQTPLEQQAGTIDALYFSGISLAILPPAGRARLLALAARLRTAGATIAFDNNYRPRLWAGPSEAAEWFASACALASLALVTLDDEEALSGPAEATGALARTLALPCPEVVVKRGADDTLVRTADGTLHEIATEKVARIVDTTAAGDSFAGAYLASRLRGGSAVQAAAAGNRLAARVVQHAGAVIPWEAMADLGAVDAGGFGR